MSERKNIYFASDLHLGMHPADDSLEREKLFVKWLDEIRADASEIWLLGDMFDYWFEYNKVVPKGFTRFQGKVASLSDEGIEIHMFTGNHDVWLFGYLASELGVEIHSGTLFRTWNGKHFLLGHGDGLLKADWNYRLLQSIFHNKLLQWFYARIHPNAATAFAQWWSKRSRLKKGSFVPFQGLKKEHQIMYAKAYLEKDDGIDYFVFGHRHIPYQIGITDHHTVIGLGDWIQNFTYAKFDGEKMELKKYLPDRGKVIRL